MRLSLNFLSICQLKAPPAPLGFLGRGKLCLGVRTWESGSSGIESGFYCVIWDRVTRFLWRLSAQCSLL